MIMHAVLTIPHARPCLTSLKEQGLFVGLPATSLLMPEMTLRALSLSVDVIDTSAAAVSQWCLFRIDALDELPDLVAKHNAASAANSPVSAGWAMPCHVAPAPQG
ncbi:hypothetical protein ABZ671_07670 [Micromonospora sp. NPDC006766]|uniref:hypothetical protein n=1 Tax=Micromonospora sp. NPDC006766 TaxID=3154778 RepID=UPI003400772C